MKHILPLLSVAGPWGRPDMSPYIFVNKISNDEPIDVYGNGDMYRDFTYVGDIVDGISRCIDLGDDDQVRSLRKLYAIHVHVNFWSFNLGNRHFASL